MLEAAESLEIVVVQSVHLVRPGPFCLLQSGGASERNLLSQ